MSYPFSVQAVILVGLIAVVHPILVRIISSPWVLLCLSPVILLIVGIAFLVLHIFVGHFLDSKRPSHHKRLYHSPQPFPFSTPAAWQAVLTRTKWSQNSPQSFPPLLPDAPVLSAEVNEVLTMVVRDFVLTWYKELSSSPSFPLAVSSLLHGCLDKLIDRASVVDIPSLIVKRILPKMTAHIDQFRQSEVALRGAGLERRLTESEELDLLLANRYASGKDAMKLHSAIDNLSTTFTRQSEEMHLRHLVDTALPFILPDIEGKSKAIRIVAREIVACSVLFPIMDMLSDPDFWNRTIDQVAGAAIHQQKLITKVRNVLEAQSPKNSVLSPAPPNTTLPTTEAITIRTDIRHFESFLRSINRCSSLLDARRLKNDIVGEIRRTRILLADHEKEDWINGEKTEDVVAFLDRLYTAKRKVEQRIIVLGGSDNSRQSAAYPESVSPKSHISLRDVLRDPGSISYFMEFMDRRNRSLLVQFWLTVESFKNPLESVDSGSDDDDDELVNDPSDAITAKEDITMVNDLYFSSSTPHPLLASIPKKYVEAIRMFSHQDTPTPSSQRRVRRSVMRAQMQVERDMEQDFEDFERSELWFKAMGDTDFVGRKALDGSPVKERQTTINPSPLQHSSAYKTTVHPPFRHAESLPAMPLHRADSFGSVQSSNSMSSSTRAMLPPSNLEVLMSPISDSVSSTRAPLFDDPDDQDQRIEEQRMEAIRSALTDIMASEEDHGSVTQSLLSQGGSHLKSHSISSRRRRPMFDDEIEQEEAEDVDDDPHEGYSEHRQSFQLAAPGDLQLSYEISRLSEKIFSLDAQQTMLQTLIKKAELTGDKQEMKLLNESKASMNRDIRELQFQKVQYEQQESANRLISDRTRITIASSSTAEEDGKSVVRYLVEVQQLALDGSFASGWVVARRYNEFLNMHNKLRDKYAAVRTLEFPGKRLVPAISSTLIDNRKAALEKYLQNVIAIPAACEGDELRSFLSRDSPFATSANQSSTPKTVIGFSGSNLVRTVYKSVTDSIDDMFFGPSMLDVMIQRLTRQAAEFAGIVGSGVTDEDLVAQALTASGKFTSQMPLSGDLKPLGGETSTSSFTAPICDLLLAIFELKREHNWLRRQAIVIILQQVLGGTIERKFRETIKNFLGESRFLEYLKIFRDSLWPGGKLKPPSTPRTHEEKYRTRDEANRKLSALFPDLAANVIGRSNARRGARRIFAVLQNRRLNQHIAYTIVDEVFAALFPEASTSIL